MIRVAIPRTLAWAFVAAWLVAGCAASPPFPIQPIEPRPGEFAALSSQRIERELGDRILALDPEHVSADDVAQVLAGAPAPRIMLIHGGVYPVYLAMTSFGTFLAGMGYPETRIRDPGNGDWSYSPYAYTPRLAGIAAWQYEQDAMRPMIVGHSQGGLYVVKVLRELAGVYRSSLAVWNPLTDAAEPRDTIVDPFSGSARPVIGLVVAYASALGAGGWSFILPNQWDDFPALRTIPDTVVEFTGFDIEFDPFAMTFPGTRFANPYVAAGTAKVRNVALPADTSHVLAPVTADLLQDPRLRAWIESYVPGRAPPPEDPPEAARGSTIWAADVWHSVKRHWVLELKRVVRAQRDLASGRRLEAAGLVNPSRAAGREGPRMTAHATAAPPGPSRR